MSLCLRVKKKLNIYFFQWNWYNSIHLQNWLSRWRSLLAWWIYLRNLKISYNFFFSNCHNLISQFLKFWGKCLAQHNFAWYDKYGIMYLPVVWNWIESWVVWNSTSVLKGFTVRANKPLPKKCYLSDELDLVRVIIIYNENLINVKNYQYHQMFRLQIPPWFRSMSLLKLS